MNSLAGKFSKCLSLGYFGFLTVLLLSRDPAKVIGMSHGLPRVLAALLPVSHLLSFSVLTFLMLIARWPLPRWFVATLLILYGGATEVFQSLVPGRRPDMADWLQDVAGVAIGSLLFLFLAVLLKAGHRRFFRLPPLESSIAGGQTSVPFDAWDALLRVRREAILPSDLGGGD